MHQMPGLWPPPLTVHPHPTLQHLLPGTPCTPPYLRQIRLSYQGQSMSSHYHQMQQLRRTPPGQLQGVSHLPHGTPSSNWEKEQGYLGFFTCISYYFVRLQAGCRISFVIKAYDVPTRTRLTPHMRWYHGHGTMVPFCI